MPNIHHELIIGVPAEMVYQAITTQQGLSAWWTPGVTTKTEVGIIRIPFGPDYFKEMRITRLEPSAFVSWECMAGAEEWIGTKLTFQLEEGDKKTLLQKHPEVSDQLQQLDAATLITVLSFHQEGWKDYTPMYAECNYTWGRFLRSLKLYCETGKGMPWPEQHGVKSKQKAD